MMRGFRMGRRGPHPANGKIYDITHADTNEHSVALPAGYPANTKALYVRATRVAGTGYFSPRSVAGDINSQYTLLTTYAGLWVHATDGLFYYTLNVANDDWDIFAIAYITA